MKYLVGWKNPRTGKMKRVGLEELDARSIYDAKKRFLSTRVKGTMLETVRMSELLTLVQAKSMEDDRVKIPLPGDFNINEWVDKEEKEALK